MPIPVILDTDIGSDVDDTWALAQLLRCPELDLKMVLTTGGDTAYRGAIAAKMLQIAGREDIPIALGVSGQPGAEFQKPWLAGSTLADYANPVCRQGVDAAVDLLRSHPGCTVISIGPASNVARMVTALGEDIASHRFVGMHGSVRVGYGNKPPIAAETNVRLDPAALRTVFAAPWADILITPLDTCGCIQLSGERYQRLCASGDALVQAVLENYRVFAGLVTWMTLTPQEVATRSSTLFDTVAIYLAYSDDLVEIETLPLVISDDGFTNIDPDLGQPIRTAMAWNNRDTFLDHLLERLLAG